MTASMSSSSNKPGSEVFFQSLDTFKRFPFATLSAIVGTGAVLVLVQEDFYNGFGSVGSFWQFNKALFLRILHASLYAVVLDAGLTIALLAVDNPFDVEMSGVPKSFFEREGTLEYPKGLNIFTQSDSVDPGSDRPGRVIGTVVGILGVTFVSSEDGSEAG